MSNKTELVGYDEHASHLKRKEVKLVDGALKVHNDNFALLDEGITNIETALAGNINVKFEDLTSSLNHEHASNNKSISVGLKGRTDIADHSTAVPVRVDGNGNLMTQVINTINTAPANSTNSHITDDPANSFAVGLKARTTIGTATTETFLKCDSNGNLDTNKIVDRVLQVITQDSTGANLSGSMADGVISETIDLAGFGGCSLTIFNHSSGGTTSVMVQGSNDNTNWEDIVQTSSPALIGLGTQLNTRQTEGLEPSTYRYLRIHNNSGSAQTFNYIHVVKLKL